MKPVVAKIPVPTMLEITSAVALMKPSWRRSSADLAVWSEAATRWFQGHCGTRGRRFKKGDSPRPARDLGLVDHLLSVGGRPGAGPSVRGFLPSLGSFPP